MTDHAPSLATEGEARDLLGADTLEEAFASGSLRRVVAEDGVHYIVGADIDRVAREHDPRHLARVVNGEVDEHEGDGPRALAADMPRL